jgi:hypothetical protein
MISPPFPTHLRHTSRPRQWLELRGRGGGACRSLPGEALLDCSSHPLPSSPTVSHLLVLGGGAAAGSPRSRWPKLPGHGGRACGPLSGPPPLPPPQGLRRLPTPPALWVPRLPGIDNFYHPQFFLMSQRVLIWVFPDLISFGFWRLSRSKSGGDGREDESLIVRVRCQHMSRCFP